MVRQAPRQTAGSSNTDLGFESPDLWKPGKQQWQRVAGNPVPVKPKWQRLAACLTSNRYANKVNL